MKIIPDADLGNGYTFRAMLQGRNDATLEIYGWVEKDYSIVKGSGGFYRTDDHVKARAIARANLEGEGLL